MKLLVRCKFTTVATAKKLRLETYSSFTPSSPTVCRTLWAPLVGSGAEPQPPTSLVLLNRKVLMPLKSTISCRGRSGVPKGGREGDSPRAALWGGGKKGKNENKKKRKKGGKKFGEACNYSKTEMEHFSCGAPIHVKPRILAPQAIRRGRAVRLYVLLHRAPKCIGALYIMAPLRFARALLVYTNLSNLITNRFAPLHILASLSSKSTYNLTFWCTCCNPHICVPGDRRQYNWQWHSVVNYRKTMTIRAAGCMTAVGAKRVENFVNAISILSKALAAGAPPQTPSPQ